MHVHSSMYLNMNVSGNVQSIIFPYCSQFQSFQCLSLTLELRVQLRSLNSKPLGSTCFFPFSTDVADTVPTSLAFHVSAVHLNGRTLLPAPSFLIEQLLPLFCFLSAFCSSSKLNFHYQYHLSLFPKKFQILYSLYDYSIIYIHCSYYPILFMPLIY